MKKKLTKPQQNLLKIYDAGFRVLPSGMLIDPKGKEAKTNIKKSNNDRVGYWRKGFCIDGKEITFLIHRLHALILFGSKALFQKGIVVRHKDGDSLNNKWDNLELGTHKENMMDVPESFRKERASRCNRKHSDKKVKKIREHYKNGKTRKERMKQYKIPKSSLSFILNNKYYLEENNNA